MFKQNLTDAERDLVVQSLTGTTLVDLIRASVTAVDLAGLAAAQRNNAFASNGDSLKPVYDLSITPWGLAMLGNRLEALQAHLSPEDICRPLITRSSHGDGYQQSFDELIMSLGWSESDNCIDMHLWAIKQIAIQNTNGRLFVDDERYERDFKPGFDLGANMVDTLCGTSKYAQDLLLQVIMHSPEILHLHFSTALERLCSDENLVSLDKLLRQNVDWSLWNNHSYPSNGSLGIEDGMLLLSEDHPLRLVISFIRHEDVDTADSLLSVTLRVMVDAGHEDVALMGVLDFSSGDSGGTPDRPFSFEVANLGMTKTLEMLLASGLDPQLNFGGTTLIESCAESTHTGAANSLSMLRARLAQKEAGAAVDNVLLTRTSALFCNISAP